MPDPSQNLIGGRYEIISPLGKGGMGVVYKAYDPVLDRTVAIKKMAASIVDHDEFRQRFFVEARAVARLNHPNIVTIHELEEDEAGIYIVMEMLDGMPLSAVMKNGLPLSRDTQVTLLSKVASGLDYAHQRGVVHRDIKPANLMLTTTGGVKILDFGIARFASSDLTSLGGTMLGTPHYMSPEQIEGRPVDARADWFSFGAVAYELVARQKPFDAASMPPLLMKITSTPHVPLIDVVPDTVPPLSAIVDKLLAKSRDDRPANGADVQCALTASGDTNREDLIASVVKSVLGDAGDVTIIQPMSARGLTGPMIAAKPTTPPLVIPGSTSTTPMGLPRGSNSRGPLTPNDPTQAVVPGAMIQPSTVALPNTTPAPSAPPAAPTGTSTLAISPQSPVTAPVAAPQLVSVPTATVSTGTGESTRPVATPPAAGAPVAPAAPVATAPPPPAPSTPVAVASAVPPGIPAKRSSLKGALLVVGLLLFLIAASGAAGIYWWVTQTASGQFALNSLLGRKPEVTTASTTASTTTTTPSTEPAATTPPASATSPSATTATPADANTPQPPVTSPSTSTQTVQTQPVAPDSTSPGATTPGTSSLPSAPSDGKPISDPTSATPPAPVESKPSSKPSTAAPFADATPTGTPTSTPTPSRPTTEPRAEGPKRSAAPSEPLPPERGPAPPPPPADDASHVAARDTRAPLDQSTVDAFKGSRGSSAPSGYGNVDSPMMQASVVRIKDTLETYSQAIEHQDLDALRAVRESLTAAESAQAQSASPTVVHFSEVDVRTDGKTAAVRARRAISVGGASKANGYVEIRLTRRPSGWVITDIH